MRRLIDAVRRLLGCAVAISGEPPRQLFRWLERDDSDDGWEVSSVGFHPDDYTRNTITFRKDGRERTFYGRGGLNFTERGKADPPNFSWQGRCWAETFAARGTMYIGEIQEARYAAAMAAEKEARNGNVVQEARRLAAKAAKAEPS